MNTHLYVQISADSITVRNAGSGESVTRKAAPGFTTQRLLVGQFKIAETLLRDAVKEVSPRWSLGSKFFVLHPLDMIEGGLSEVEEKVFMELAMSAGALRTLIWTEQRLSDQEVIDKLK